MSTNTTETINTYPKLYNKNTGEIILRGYDDPTVGALGALVFAGYNSQLDTLVINQLNVTPEEEQATREKLLSWLGFDPATDMNPMGSLIIPTTTEEGTETAQILDWGSQVETKYMSFVNFLADFAVTAVLDLSGEVPVLIDVIKREEELKLWEPDAIKEVADQFGFKVALA